MSRKSARITGFIVITSMVGDGTRDVKRALSVLRRRPRWRVTLFARLRSRESGPRPASLDRRQPPRERGSMPVRAGDGWPHPTLILGRRLLEMIDRESSPRVLYAPPPSIQSSRQGVHNLPGGRAVCRVGPVAPTAAAAHFARLVHNQASPAVSSNRLPHGAMEGTFFHPNPASRTSNPVYYHHRARAINPPWQVPDL